MIYQETLCALREDLMGTGYFSHLYEFAVMEQQGEVIKPVYYKDGSNMVDVMNFDQNGSGYIRKNGKASFSRANTRDYVSCDAKIGDIELRVPFRAVFGVPKTKLNNDTFSSERLAINLINFFHRELESVQGISAVGRLINYDTDREAIYKAETNVGYSPILELAYISIDFEIIYTGNVSCFLETCSYY